MKTKYYLLLTILFIVIIFALGCAPQQQKPETPSVEKTSASEIKQAREDFGCFYSCDFFPAGSKQMCEDWKSDKEVQWPPDCKMMQYGPCIKLCEFEKKNNPQALQNFSDNNSQQQNANQNQQQQQLEIPAGVPASDPEAGSVYIYISDFDVGCVNKCEIFNFNYTNSRIMRIDDMTGKNWVSFGTIGKGVNQFNTPNHLTVGPDGKIYIADSLNDRIVRMDDMTGEGWITYGVHGRTGEFNTPSQVNLPPGEGRLIHPMGVKFDSKGRIYIMSATLIRIDDMTGKGWVTYGTKGSGIGQFEDELNGLSFDAQERIYISDEHNDRIVRIDDMTGKGWIEFGGLPNDKIGQPHDVSITKTGHIYILDTTYRRIVRIDDMTGKGWIAFAPDAKTEDARYFHKWHLSAPHGMFVVEKD